MAKKLPYQIRQVSHSSPELATSFAKMLDVLAPHRAPHDPSQVNRDLERTINAVSPTDLFIAQSSKYWNDSEVWGAICLTQYPTLGGRQAILSDLIVMPAHRRKGIGEALCLQAISRVNGNHVELTCNFRREDARRIYERLGFKQRETGVYHLDFKKG